MQSIGERLEEARKRKGVTIREAAEATKIRGEYLNSFENNNFGISVPDIYVRGFLRSYCNFLKVNGEKVITDYNATLIGEAKAAKREHREFFGRMELQQPPLVNEEGKADAGKIVDPDVQRPEEEGEPSGFQRFLERIDKEVAIKIGIVAVIAIMLLLLIIWLFRALTSGGIEPDPAAAPGSGSRMVPAQNDPARAPGADLETIVLKATGDVRVTVTERDSGRVLVNLFPMVAGQELPVEKSGPVKIDYTAGENLQVEFRGTTYGTGKTGENYSTIP